MFTRSLGSALVAGCLTAVGAAQIPLQDTGFSPTTSFPDPDLVVVRERAYGAGGIDLTSYGIGSGVESYVQSIYFRFFTGSSHETAANGLVVFPDGVEILGFVTDGPALGGGIDDQVASETDGFFGVAADPDDYSELGRGLESVDYVCSMSSNTFLFMFNTMNGVDDFRVIIDYGESFPTGIDFDLYMFGPGAFRGAEPSEGIRIGHDLLPVVFGSGDYGEVDSLADIPLTSNTSPCGPARPPLQPLHSFYVVRNNTGVSAVDAIDWVSALAHPAKFLFDSPGAPVDISGGPDGLLYAIGVGGNLTVMDVVGGGTFTYEIQNRNGSNVDMTPLAGTRDLFIVRDTDGDTIVDRLNVDTLEFVDHYHIASTVINTPVGITDGYDGMLYVLSRHGTLVRIDPQTGEMTSFALAPPEGHYVGLTRDEYNVNLYLLRNTPGLTCVDKHLSDCAVVEYDWVLFEDPATPVDITFGPKGYIFVMGEEGTSSPLLVIDPRTGAINLTCGCLNFTGSVTGLAYTPGSFGETYCSPAVPNSTGDPAWISAHGSTSIFGGLELAAWNLPPQTFGYFLTSRVHGFVANPGGSRGHLCLSGQIGRFNAYVQNAGDLGRLRLNVDPKTMPLNPPKAVVPGETWYFQAWFRDNDPGPTSNFTDAIAVIFD